MSLRTVELVVGRLLTDEEVRFRFARDPLDTVSAWLNAGFELTGREIETLIQTDASVWSRAAEPFDARHRG